ncbi:alpha/beta hydrolase [Litoreibacter albidus]|uniref:alpha/beta hydrolase n=1 Tax=Litoreibacter albidus TaxID=670155 RepID=UPI003735CAF5
MHRFPPRPSGPFHVGTISTTITDPNRHRFLDDASPGRVLFLKIWYPSNGDESAKYPERLWRQLHDADQTPLAIRYLSKWGVRRKSNSYENLPYVAEAGRPRLVVYNHGLVSFASENTSLMEHLASHGNTVISIEHLHQLAEFKRLTGAKTQAQRDVDKRDLARIQSATGMERAELSRCFYKGASVTNRIVAARSTDCLYSLERLPEIIGHLSGIDTAELQIDNYATVGFSLGGAVSTELAKTDPRVNAAVNLDGGIYGQTQNQPIACPYLMVYSADNHASNAICLEWTPDSQETVATYTFEECRHINLHDICGILPVLRWLPMTGTARPIDVLQKRNRLIHSFLRENALA